jgi:hypothetical protein
MKRETLGTALAIQGRPPTVRPNQRTGNIEYRKNHPVFTSPAVRSALPSRAVAGIGTANVTAYVRSLNGK